MPWGSGGEGRVDDLEDIPSAIGMSGYPKSEAVFRGEEGRGDEGVAGCPRKAADRRAADDGPHRMGDTPMTPAIQPAGPFQASGRVGDDGLVSDWDEDPDEGRAPICPYCGVTALPAELSHVLDTDFVCDNADCDAYGERVDP